MSFNKDSSQQDSHFSHQQPTIAMSQQRQHQQQQQQQESLHTAADYSSSIDVSFRSIVHTHEQDLESDLHAAPLSSSNGSSKRIPPIDNESQYGLPAAQQPNLQQYVMQSSASFTQSSSSPSPPHSHYRLSSNSFSHFDDSSSAAASIERNTSNTLQSSPRSHHTRLSSHPHPHPHGVPSPHTSFSSSCSPHSMSRPTSSSHPQPHSTTFHSRSSSQLSAPGVSRLSSSSVFFSSKKERIAGGYRLGNVLGVGTYGEVRYGVKINGSNGEEDKLVAVKIIDQSKFLTDGAMKEMIQKEVFILKLIQYKQMKEERKARRKHRPDAEDDGEHEQQQQDGERNMEDDDEDEHMDEEFDYPSPQQSSAFHFPRRRFHRPNGSSSGLLSLAPPRPHLIRLLDVVEDVPFTGDWCEECACTEFKPLPNGSCAFCTHELLAHVAIPEMRNVLLIVEELAIAGELFNIVNYSGPFTEELARYYFRQLIAGLEFLHGLHVVHRDLKSENLVLNEQFQLKIIDYGLSAVTNLQAQSSTAKSLLKQTSNVGSPFQKQLEMVANMNKNHGHFMLTTKGMTKMPSFFDDGRPVLHSGVGSLPYAAPEVVLHAAMQSRNPPPGKREAYSANSVFESSGYDGMKADIWSAAVILYVMLMGRPPFLRPLSKTFGPTFRRCKYYAQLMRGESYGQLSEGTRSFLALLFRRQPNERLNLHEIKQHPWFSGPIPPHEILQKQMEERVRKVWTMQNRGEMYELLRWMREKEEIEQLHAQSVQLGESINPVVGAGLDSVEAEMRRWHLLNNNQPTHHSSAAAASTRPSLSIRTSALHSAYAHPSPPAHLQLPASRSQQSQSFMSAFHLLPTPSTVTPRVSPTPFSPNTEESQVNDSQFDPTSISRSHSPSHSPSKRPLTSNAFPFPLALSSPSSPAIVGRRDRTEEFEEQQKRRRDRDADTDADECSQHTFDHQHALESITVHLQQESGSVFVDHRVHSQARGPGHSSPFSIPPNPNASMLRRHDDQPPATRHLILSHSRNPSAQRRSPVFHHHQLRKRPTVAANLQKQQKPGSAGLYLKQKTAATAFMKTGLHIGMPSAFSLSLPALLQALRSVFQMLSVVYTEESQMHNPSSAHDPEVTTRFLCMINNSNKCSTAASSLGANAAVEELCCWSAIASPFGSSSSFSLSAQLCLFDVFCCVCHGGDCDGGHSLSVHFRGGSRVVFNKFLKNFQRATSIMQQHQAPQHRKDK